MTTEDSVQLYYKVMGEGQDTIVVIHGGPYNSSYLSSDLRPLAAHHTMIYYDQRASGYSTVIRDTALLSIWDNVQDIESIRKYFRLQKLNLMAHSAGGAISAYYAVTYPDNIKSMIMVNSIPAGGGWSVDFDSKIDSTSLAIKNRNAQAFYNSPTDSLKACWDLYALVARGYYPTPVKVRRMWGDVCNCNQANMLNPNKWYIYQTMSLDLISQLGKVKAPVLIIAGIEDAIPVGSFEQWQESLPNSFLFKIPQAAHFPHVDQPNAFFSAVESFLQNKIPDESLLQASGAGIILAGDEKGTAYQQARAEVIRVEDELVRLLNKAEWDSVAAIYAIDASILAPGTPPVVGRDAISSFWYTAALRGMSSIELQLMDLEISGDFLIGRGKYQMNDEQKEIIDIGKFVAIYRKEKGEWLLQTDMFNTSMETRSPIEVPDYLKP